MRLQYVTRRRPRRRDPVLKEASGEPYSRRLFFSSVSSVASSHHRKLMRLRKDAESVNGTSMVCAHALSAGRPTGGEPCAIASLQLPVSKRERRIRDVVETQL